jgi:hypothetical protein
MRRLRDFAWRQLARVWISYWLSRESPWLDRVDRLIYGLVSRWMAPVLAVLVLALAVMLLVLGFGVDSTWTP